MNFILNSGEFNTERCRPVSDLGRNFSADLNFEVDFSRAVTAVLHLVNVKLGVL